MTTWTVSSASPTVTDEDVAAVVAVLRSGMLANGPQGEALEREFALRCDVAHAVAVANGTAALVLAGQAAGLGAGDLVLVAGYTFAASANAFLAQGCRVAPVDVDADSMNVTAAHVADAIEQWPDAKAIVVVDLFGNTQDTEGAIDVARERGLVVIEDAAQAHGARDGRGRAVGSRANATTFSFYATKNITGGEGGMVVTPLAAVANAVRLLRSHGALETYRHESIGLNLRLPEMAAALVRSQLARLDEVTAARHANARQLAVWCNELWPSVAVPAEATTPGPTHVFHQFVVRLPDRDRRDGAATALRNAGIDARIFYPYAVADLPGVEPATTPVAATLRDTTLALPVHPGVTESQREHLRRTMAAVARELAL